MSGGVCEVVRAETADLDRFVERGGRFVASLRAVFDEVAASRSRLVGQLGAAAVPPAGAAKPMGGFDPLAELIAEATLANAFVGEVSGALQILDANGVAGLVPAESVDAALARAGLDGLGADRSRVVDQELVEALAIRRRLAEIVAVGDGGPDHLQGHMIGLELEDYLAGLDAGEAEQAATVLIDYGIDLQASLDPQGGNARGQRAAATMLVTQGLLLLPPGDRAGLVDDLAEQRVLVGGGDVLALSLLVDALDVEGSNEDLTVFGFGAGGWHRANQPWVRHAALSDLIGATQGADGRISVGGQALVDDVLDRYPGVVEVAAGTWHDSEEGDRYLLEPGGGARVWPTAGLRTVLAMALAAPNYGLDDAQYDAALALGDLEDRLAGPGIAASAAELLGFEREVLIGLLADGDPDRMVLIAQALASGLSPAEAVRLAHFGSDQGLTDARVRRLRVVYDTTPWGDPVPVDSVDPEVFPDGVALALASELGVLQNIQLARFGRGRPLVDVPLSDGQIELVARYDEVARWFHHRFAWGWPGGAEDAVDYLVDLDDGELERIFGEVPDGFGDLLDDLADPGNQVVWDLMAGASGNDTFLGPDGTYRPGSGRTVTSADPGALLVQLKLLGEVGPYHELLDGDGDGVISEGEVKAWLEAAADDPSIPPALADRIKVGTSFGIGEDTFGWDEIAAIIGIVGLTAAAVVTIAYSGGTAAPLWVKGGLIGLAGLEAYAAHQADDDLGTILALGGGAADLLAAARIFRLGGAASTERHAELLTLARRSDIPAIRALAGEANQLSTVQFARRYEAILDDLGYDRFLDAIATRSLDEQLEIVRNIERYDLSFVPIGRTDAVRGHPAARHGPHITDEAMLARAQDEGFAVSRWESWNTFDRAVVEAQAAVTDEATILATRGAAGNPISSRGWARIDAGRLTLSDILYDPRHRHLLKKEVKYAGTGGDTGSRFHTNGTVSTDDSFVVILRLDENGDYRTLTAYPTAQENP